MFLETFERTTDERPLEVMRHERRHCREQTAKRVHDFFRIDLASGTIVSHMRVEERCSAIRDLTNVARVIVCQPEQLLQG